MKKQTNKQSFLWWFNLFDSNFPLTSSYKMGIYLKTSKSSNEKKGYMYCSLNDKSALKEVYKTDEV